MGSVKRVAGRYSSMAAISRFHKLLLVVALILTNEASVLVMIVTADQSLQPPLISNPVTSYFKTMAFDGSFSNLWGAGHQNVSQDGKAVTLKIDRYSGGGFKSKQSYMYGFFNAALKLQAGYTAGIVTTLYLHTAYQAGNVTMFYLLSNSQVYPDRHDELDFEFLGTIPGEPYKLHTNIYGNGTGDGDIPGRVGREQQFHLWFDPTQDFHNYSILWTPQHIMFLVDSIPIRQFPKLKSVESQYPSKPVSIYATLWDASDWATDGGKYKANYSYEPFLSTYTNFIISGCTPDQRDCVPGYFDQLIPPTLSTDLKQALDFVRKNYMIYDYCQDVYRYPHGLPECPRSSPGHHA